MSLESQFRVQLNSKIVDHFPRRQSDVACRDVVFQRYILLVKNINSVSSIASLSSLSSSHDFPLIMTWLIFLLASSTLRVTKMAATSSAYPINERYLASQCERYHHIIMDNINKIHIQKWRKQHVYIYRYFAKAQTFSFKCIYQTVYTAIRNAK